jgi:hypothetical protein
VEETNDDRDAVRDALQTAGSRRNVSGDEQRRKGGEDQNAQSATDSFGERVFEGGRDVTLRKRNVRVSR